jgi:hypothetical protein
MFKDGSLNMPFKKPNERSQGLAHQRRYRLLLLSGKKDDDQQWR